MLGRVSAAVAACAVSSMAYAKPQLDPNNLGTSSCAKFNKVLVVDPHWTKDNYFSWAQGFMAGADVAAATIEHSAQSRVSDLNAISVDEQWARLTAFCASHPRATFAQGVWVLYLSFPLGLVPIPTP